ncbi:hypothetical protein PVAND_012487 [Polypedilum vanderplanki]|uniref:Protein quiver n=1 Tax=Polypedilum vanderplanki TaxID=319348 RepID=A0A9J6CMV9_POLVA|nr:hypothetical protein PVAND_012487 [Polypedilum vanderplanki]
MKVLTGVLLLISFNYSLAIICFNCSGTNPECNPDLSNNGIGLENNCTGTDYCVFEYSKGIIFFIFINDSLAIKCYDCTGNDSKCQDMIDNKNEFETECNSTNYCVLKYLENENLTEIPMTILTIRTCGDSENHLKYESNMNMTSKCEENFNDTDGITYLYYCECDGGLCNTVTRNDDKEKYFFEGLSGKFLGILAIIVIFSFGCFYARI